MSIVDKVYFFPVFNSSEGGLEALWKFCLALNHSYSRDIYQFKCIIYRVPDYEPNNIAYGADFVRIL